MTRARDLADLGGNAATLEKQGLTLISTNSFSAVSSVSLPADTFTSTYNDYKILFRLTASGGAGYVQMRLRASGADNSTSNYNSQAVGRRITGTTVGLESGNDNLFYLFTKDSADSAGALINLFSPKATNNTLYNSSIQSVFINTSDPTNFAGGGIFKATTSFDSATFISSVSTITGSVSVFGYSE
jgi:hypothetical protein